MISSHLLAQKCSISNAPSNCSCLALYLSIFSSQSLATSAHISSSTFLPITCGFGALLSPMSLASYRSRKSRFSLSTGYHQHLSPHSLAQGYIENSSYIPLRSPPNPLQNPPHTPHPRPTPYPRPNSPLPRTLLLFLLFPRTLPNLTPASTRRANRRAVRYFVAALAAVRTSQGTVDGVVETGLAAVAACDGCWGWRGGGARGGGEGGGGGVEYAG